MAKHSSVWRECDAIDISRPANRGIEHSTELQLHWWRRARKSLVERGRQRKRENEKETKTAGQENWKENRSRKQMTAPAKINIHVIESIRQSSKWLRESCDKMTERIHKMHSISKHFFSALIISPDSDIHTATLSNTQDRAFNLILYLFIFGSSSLSRTWSLTLALSSSRSLEINKINYLVYKFRAERTHTQTLDRWWACASASARLHSMHISQMYAYVYATDHANCMPIKAASIPLYQFRCRYCCCCCCYHRYCCCCWQNRFGRCFNIVNSVWYFWFHIICLLSNGTWYGDKWLRRREIRKCQEIKKNWKEEDFRSGMAHECRSRAKQRPKAGRSSTHKDRKVKDFKAKMHGKRYWGQWIM